ncbi:MAG: alkaline phosphatase family protein [Terriglobales bacterium]
MDARASAAGDAGPGARVHIYVLMDALGWSIAQEHGFLRDALGHRRPLRTCLGYSSGAIPTMLTGAPPAEHGHWNLLYLDPHGSPFGWMRGLPAALTTRLDHRWGRRGCTWLGRHACGLGPGFECAVRPDLLPWFNWAEKRHLFQPGSLAPVPNVFDHWREAHLRFRIYSYRHGSDQSLIRRACRDVASGRADTVFLYLCEMDHILHLHRDEPEVIQAALDAYAGQLEALLAAARARDPQMRFRLFSDHGMAPVRQRVDLLTPLRRRGWQSPQDYLAVLDSTMLRFWFFRPSVRDDISAWLHGLSCGHILEESELRREGVCFEDARFGDLIFLLDPGTMVAEGEFNGRGWNPCGMHGYHPADADSDAVLLSNCAHDLHLKTIQDLFTPLNEPLLAPRGSRPVQ